MYLVQLMPTPAAPESATPPGRTARPASPPWPRWPVVGGGRGRRIAPLAGLRRPRFVARADFLQVRLLQLFQVEHGVVGLRRDEDQFVQLELQRSCIAVL